MFQGLIVFLQNRMVFWQNGSKNMLSHKTIFIPTYRYECKYSRMKKVNFFKDSLPEILFGLLLNTFSHI